MWTLWQKSRLLNQAPSEIMGLTKGSYEAYSLDEAVLIFGSEVQNELEKAGHKPSKQENSTAAIQKKILAKYFGESKATKDQFADPAALFNTM